MKALHATRLKIRRELEAPPALRKFGSGWISGVLGMMFGLAALGCVVMMRFPGVFTMKENAAVIGHPAFRTGMFVLMVLAFGFSLLSLLLRSGKALGITGMVVAGVAASVGAMLRLPFTGALIAVLIASGGSLDATPLAIVGAIVGVLLRLAYDKKTGHEPPVEAAAAPATA